MTGSVLHGIASYSGGDDARTRFLESVCWQMSMFVECMYSILYSKRSCASAFLTAGFRCTHKACLWNVRDAFQNRLLLVPTLTLAVEDAKEAVTLRLMSR